MRQIRQSVFETNSSSSHSISVGRNGTLHANQMCVDDDGYIHGYFDEFGWEIRNHHDQHTKLAYLLTMAAHKNDIYPSAYNDKECEENISEFIQTDDFKKISNEIASYAGCNGVVMDVSSGYIDHQSSEDYSSLDDFLSQNDTSIIEFIFNDGVVVHTDNDNH